MLAGPGGHMQWDELDLTNMQGPFSPGGGSVESLQEMADNLRRVLPPGFVDPVPPMERDLLTSWQLDQRAAPDAFQAPCESGRGRRQKGAALAA